MCRGARVDLVVPQLHRVRAAVLLLVGERDTAHIAASRGAYWLLPETARLEVVPNAGHLLDDPDALDRVACEAEHWFGETLDANPSAESTLSMVCWRGCRPRCSTPFPSPRRREFGTTPDERASDRPD